MTNKLLSTDVMSSLWLVPIKFVKFPLILFPTKWRLSFSKWVMVPLQYCLCATDHSRTLVRFIQVMKPKPRFSLSLYLCSDCCVTPHWLIHVCEQQGVVFGVCDSLLSHKECFQSLPTSTGTKYVLNFRDFHGNSGAAPTKKKFLVVGSHAGDMQCKRSKPMCVVPNSRQCANLLSVWPMRGIITLRWHTWNAFLSISLSGKHRWKPRWLKYSNVKIRQREGSSWVQTVWNAAKLWSALFPLPSLPEESLPLFLSFQCFHLSLFSFFSPLCLQSALSVLHFYFLCRLEFLPTYCCLCESLPAHSISLLRHILMLGHFRCLASSPSLPLPQTDIFSSAEKKWEASWMQGKCFLLVPPKENAIF